MKITFNMATIPSRFKYALGAIDSIYDQADEIRIYLNNFEEVPEELKREKITTHIGKDLRSTGKLFWSLNPNEYYFCIDDDLRYPSTYAKDMIQYLNAFKDKVYVSLHGKLLNPTPLKSYFRGGVNHSFHCLEGFPNSTFVHVVGNGVSAFNTNHIKIDYTKFKYHYMDDIEVSLQLQKQQIPSLVIAHDPDYLSYEDFEKDGIKSLYSQYYNNDSTQTERVNSIKWEIYEI
tara:strand:- start:1116 stop:1811 length:696 start_codon:yes stop_codon:yes gene_type:complete